VRLAAVRAGGLGSCAAVPGASGQNTIAKPSSSICKAAGSPGRVVVVAGAPVGRRPSLRCRLPSAAPSEFGFHKQGHCGIEVKVFFKFFSSSLVLQYSSNFL